MKSKIQILVVNSTDIGKNRKLKTNCFYMFEGGFPIKVKIKIRYIAICCYDIFINIGM